MTKKSDVSIALVTPYIASEWLSRNGVNRKINDQNVQKYIIDMKNGRWNIGESAIVFDKDGTLINGQHRLIACVRSGVSFRSIVRLNAERKEIAAMDSGGTRKESDSLWMSGIAERKSVYTNRTMLSFAKLILNDEKMAMHPNRMLNIQLSKNMKL